jgi:hypothetical protein
MIMVWFLALVGLAFLIALAGLAVVGASRLRPPAKPGDPFDLALEAAARLQADAWDAVQKIRQLDDQKGDD